MRTDRITVYRDAADWRWCYVASNGRVLADGGRGYSRRKDCLRGAARVMGGAFLGFKEPQAISGRVLLGGIRGIPVVIEP